MIARGSIEAATWRRAVMSRDGYVCQLCGALGGQLTADHIIPWSAAPSIRFSIDNGRTLCRPCHRLLPSSGGSLASIRARLDRFSDSRTSLHYLAVELMLRGPRELAVSSQRAARLVAHEGRRIDVCVGEPSPDQQETIDAINAAGGLAFVARSAVEAIVELERHQ